MNLLFDRLISDSGMELARLFDDTREPYDFRESCEDELLDVDSVRIRHRNFDRELLH